MPAIAVLSTDASDSLYLRNAGVDMYGVSGIFMESSNSCAHGLDERVAISRLYGGREFLYRLVRKLAG